LISLASTDTDFMVTQTILCPHCHRAENVVKFGKTECKTQLFQCKSCQKTFAHEPISHKVTPEKVAILQSLLAERISQRVMQRATGVSRMTIRKILKKTLLDGQETPSFHGKIALPTLP
jgi:transposase-like protein